MGELLLHPTLLKRRLDELYDLALTAVAAQEADAVVQELNAATGVVRLGCSDHHSQEILQEAMITVAPLVRHGARPGDAPWNAAVAVLCESLSASAKSAEAREFIPILFASCRDVVVTIVRTQWHEVSAVARALDWHQALTHEEIRRARADSGRWIRKGWRTKGYPRLSGPALGG